ncbi:MAG TPA: DoxX family protein [Bacteroidales bacterium]|nr:DoxX family protein [Bacteroidales bacterium]
MVKSKNVLKNTVKVLSIISRLIIGLVFTFSGFVKAVDPLGSNYKFIDYFDAFGMPWLNTLALPLAFILSGLEFLIGICLLIGIQNKLAHWGALIFMVIFTPLTLWLALTNPVHDCGCFGDAVILTNWQTFYKNIFILILLIISFVYRNKFKPWVKKPVEWVITVCFAVIITIFSYFNLEHLPVIDFRPYKIGTHIPDKMIIPKGAPADVYEQYFTLRDTVTGKEISVESKVYVKDSSYWGKKSVYKYVSSTDPVLIKQGYVPPIHDFTIESPEGDDITADVLADSGYYFIVVAYDLNKSRTKNQALINSIYEQAVKENNKFICLTSVSTNEISAFKQKNNARYDFYLTDPITLKTIVRSNPGLVLLHKGTILAKWHSNDIPSYSEINQKYMSK